MANPTRIRVNYTKGTLGATLNSGDTTTTAFSGQPILTKFQNFTAFSTTHHLPVIVDPGAAAPEIIYITDTDLTSATISRGCEDTLAATKAVGTPYIVAPTARDFIQGWAGPFALASANTNPTFANTSGVWTALPHSTTGANELRESYVRAGDLIEVDLQLVAKVTSGSDYLALDVKLTGFTGDPMIGSSSGATGLTLTKSTSYVHLHAWGSAQLTQSDFLAPVPFYKASGAGTFGCGTSLPETNFDVIFSWRVISSAVG